MLNQEDRERIMELPEVRRMAAGEEIAWVNPELKDTAEAFKGIGLTRADVDDAEERLARFASFFKAVFPETLAYDGLIESPLTEIPRMKAALSGKSAADIRGRLYLKRDSDLAVAGSVKARGGIYEVLKHSEDLAREAGLLKDGDDYVCFASPEFREFFSRYAIHVGSTGNLGLSIGIMSAVLGYQVNVHMSADAKQWKKDLLRAKGVNVVEYAGDYSKAVAEGRKLAEQDPRSYFVDDENSVTLFLGYAVAARRLRKQLEEQKIAVDAEHPLFVTIPCGVGGAPGGICFGLKQEFGDAVQVFFAEPVESPCMLLGLATGLQEKIAVQDIGLSGLTAADGLAVGRPSRFVGKTVRNLVAGEFTVKDARLFDYMRLLLETEEIFIEPSACAAFNGAVYLPELTAFLKKIGFADKLDASSHIIWATGGRLVPAEEREKYIRTH